MRSAINARIVSGERRGAPGGAGSRSWSRSVDAAITSASITAPPGPLPRSAPRSIPLVAASRRASGDAGTRPRSSSVDRRPHLHRNGAPALRWAQPSAGFFGWARGSSSGAGDADGGAAPSRVCSRTIGVPTSTSWPTSTRNSLDDAVVPDLDVDVGLLRLDHGDQVAAVHGVARRDPPLDHPSFVHVGAE